MDTIKTKISAGQVILYRRVSTKKQVKGEYASQLRSIKCKYPMFSIVKSTKADVTEAMSGRADPEVRMASGLGKCLKLMKRDNGVILLVSDADRIARRADVFVLIQKQGLGHRVYDASTGMNVNDIVQSGRHQKIETKTEEQHQAKLNGLDAYRVSGGKLGSDRIKNYSHKAKSKKQQLAEQRRDRVLQVVKCCVRDNQGRPVSLQDICDELNHHGVRTGQGRFFTPPRLLQWKKKNRKEWRQAMNCYTPPWQRIQRIARVIRMTQIEIRHRRQRKRSMYIITLGIDFIAADARQPLHTPYGAVLHPVWRCGQLRGSGSCDPCRGPPTCL
ncbi:MAG: recombinase family protein [Thalassovita sp.]